MLSHRIYASLCFSSARSIATPRTVTEVSSTAHSQLLMIKSWHAVLPMIARLGALPAGSGHHGHFKVPALASVKGLQRWFYVQPCADFHFKPPFAFIGFQYNSNHAKCLFLPLVLSYSIHWALFWLLHFAILLSVTEMSTGCLHVLCLSFVVCLLDILFFLLLL